MRVCSLLTLIQVLYFVQCLSQPWGKDADLGQFNRKCAAPQCEPVCQSESFLSYCGKKAIQFHQEVISPADGPRSHFFPSSSEYTKQAMAKYGFFQGFVFGCDRLMRENEEEWVYLKISTPQGTLKWDPIPQRL